jgi:hypothetical protein
MKREEWVMAQKSDVTLPQNDDGVVAMPDGGIGIPDPPFVAGSTPTILAAASPDSVVTVNGSGFDSSCKGLVNGLARYTQFVSNTSLRITVTAADLANPGQLQIGVKNAGGTSNSVQLTVQ